MSALTDFRKMKDEFYAKDGQSPLTHEQKENFKGLKYFPENPSLRFELEIEEYPAQESVAIQTSTGEVRQYVRYGQIKFNVNGKEAALTVYNTHHGLFLPFVDTLAGEETYPAGRYLEIEQLDDGRYLVDFNMAYNPYCAYNDRYSCPLTPAENRLKVAIEAGEKNYK